MKNLLKFVIVGLLMMSGIAYSNPPSLGRRDTTTQPESNTGTSKTNPENNQTPTPKFPLSVEIVKTPTIQIDTHDKTEKTRDYSSHEWWLVYLSGVLAAITFFLALYTYKLWNATKKLMESAEKTTRIHERAYIHAGGDFHDNTDEFFPDVGNYGKTPAIVGDICIEVCSFDELPAIPDYSRKEFFGLPLYPGQKPIDARVWGKTRKGIKNPVVYGRVWYKDIFNDEHSSGFIYSVRATGRNPGSTYAIKAPSAYSECD